MGDEITATEQAYLDALAWLKTLRAKAEAYKHEADMQEEALKHFKESLD